MEFFGTIPRKLKEGGTDFVGKRSVLQTPTMTFGKNRQRKLNQSLVTELRRLSEAAPRGHCEGVKRGSL